MMQSRKAGNTTSLGAIKLRRSVLVTGCSTGIGLETAISLAEKGHRVYASMRNLQKRDQLEEQTLRRRVSMKVLRIDINEPSTIRDGIRQIVDETGSVFGIVNNAGLFLRGFFEDLAENEIRQLFETNLFGTMAVIREALPYMRTAGEGRIIIITSVAGYIGAPAGTAYSASRFAQEGFAESLHQELSPFGIYVTTVAPGITSTPDWTPDRYVARGAFSPESPYCRWFQNAQKLFHQAMDNSTNSPAQVADVLHEVLTSSRPRLRYLLGKRARWILRLRRCLPGELFERIYFREVMRRITSTD